MMMVSDDMEELNEITKADLNLEPVKDVIFSVTREEELEGGMILKKKED
jgi:hypothetical protein